VLYKIWKSNDKIEDEQAIIINTKLVEEPCSFFNYIFINPDSYDFETYEQILKHEKIHVSKRHSFDLLFSELAVIILWFNPLVWFWRKEVEKNIEYQTDDLLLERKAVKRDTYQMNLLKVATYTRPLTITTNYNQSLLKQRIMKMNTKKSNKQSYWKYAFIAPLLFATLLLTNNPIGAFAQEDYKQSNEVSSNGSLSLTNNEVSEPENFRDFIFSTKGCRSLLRAVKSEDIESVREFLKDQNPNCTYTGDGEPRSPLVAAARNGNLEIAQLIVAADGDAEYNAAGDESPLMAASHGGHLNLVKLLMENGADANRKVGGDGTALLVASGGGHLNTVRYLVGLGADVNATVRGDGSALINAVRNRKIEIAEILLEAGADPYLEVPGDEYPMFHARSSKNQEMIDLLKKYEK
jgi:ankyrin repeat protein